MNRTCKRIGLMLLEAGSVFKWGRWLSRRSLVTITYHRVLPGSMLDYKHRPPNSVCRDQFEQQIAYLTQHYQVLTADGLEAFIRGRELPPHSVLITFDDGYENNYTEAFPVLRQYGASAIFFLTSDLIGKARTALWFDRLDAVLSSIPFQDLARWLKHEGLVAEPCSPTDLRQWLKGYARVERDALIAELESVFMRDDTFLCDRNVCGLMTWEQVRSLAESGMVVGSHTASHQILSACSAEEVRAEVEASRLSIEQKVGKPCRYFSYPNGEAGDFRESDVLAVKLAGYTCAFTQIPGFATGAADRYALPRISVPDYCDSRVFKSYLTRIRVTAAPALNLVQAAGRSSNSYLGPRLGGPS